MSLIGKKIMVTGASSMIGAAICEQLEIDNKVDRVLHSECDLLDYKQVLDRVVRFGPTHIVHAAGWNGGISWNKKFPATIYQRTVQMGLNIYTAAIESKYHIEKILGILASCSYPDSAEGVYNPADLHDGLPNPTVECHGLAKRTLFDYGRQVYKQHGIPCIAAILTNAYGPGDSFHPEKTKVVGALIRKFVEAKQSNTPAVTCWGTGAPKRQLIYSQDAASGIIGALDNYFDYFSPINIGSPDEVSIKELTLLIADIVGYDGKIEWDISKPDGQMRKFIVCDNFCPTTLEFGLKQTIDWYVDNKEFADAKGF